MSQNLERLVPRFLAKYYSVSQALNGVNDYGEITGLCSEHDRIVQEAEFLLTMWSNRLHDLGVRAEKLKAEKLEEARKANEPA